MLSSPSYIYSLAFIFTPFISIRIVQKCRVEVALKYTVTSSS